MTLEWRGLLPSETDHELLWGLVGTAGALVATAAWATGALALPPCVFKAVTGLPCVTCGTTRALAALVAGDLLLAVRWNPLAVLAIAVLTVYVPYGAAAGLLGTRRLRVRLREREWALMRASVLALAGVTWMYLWWDGR